MADHSWDFCPLLSFKLLLAISFVVLRSLGVSITADNQNGLVADCTDEAVSSWHPWWYTASHETNGTKCNIQCPLNCSCSLGNYSEVISECPKQNLTVVCVSYPPNITHLSWAHNNLCNISKNSFAGLADTLQDMHLNNNSLQYLEPGTFESLINLVHLNLRHNLLEEIEDKMFGGLANLVWLDLNSNALKEIRSDAFKGLGKLMELSLESNLLDEIKPGAFNGLGNLSKLYLANNALKKIRPDAFNGLGNLSRLDLSSNILNEIHTGAFNGTGNLSELYLPYNMLKEIQSGVFQGLENLSKLSLSFNMLEIQSGVFGGLGRLQYLYLHNNGFTKLLPSVLGKLTNMEVLFLSDNPLGSLHPDIFCNLSSLDALILCNINLTFLPRNIFQALRQLRYLDLSVNNLQELRFHPFELCIILETLNLTQNPLQWINKDAFIGLNVTAEVFVDDPASCCFVTKANCRSSATKSPFLTCGRMLPYDVLRVGIWVVSTIAIVANAISILAKYKQRKQLNKVQFLLITNLSISDLLMGVYLIILLSVDLYYTDYFPSHSDSWRNSTLCKVAGSLSVLSSEASVFFITMISIDRAIAIKFPFRAHRGGTKSTCIIASFLWLVASGISITSFVLSGMDSDVYAVSEICVGLPISRQYTYNMSDTSVQLSTSFSDTKLVQENKATGSQAAMYFSISIFTALNLFCFLIVGFCYLTIFITATKTTKKSGRSRNLKEDIQMAKKMFLLVLTDFCCWVPIGVLSILVQAGAVEVHPVAYAWIATFILPINSSINPFLYTLGDVIADKVSCSCKNCKKQSSDENTEMRQISRSSSENN